MKITDPTLDDINAAPVGSWVVPTFARNPWPEYTFRYEKRADGWWFVDKEGAEPYSSDGWGFEPGDFAPMPGDELHVSAVSL